MKDLLAVSQAGQAAGTQAKFRRSGGPGIQGPKSKSRQMATTQAKLICIFRLHYHRNTCSG